jgi:hypothetical protein
MIISEIITLKAQFSIIHITSPRLEWHFTPNARHTDIKWNTVFIILHLHSESVCMYKLQRFHLKNTAVLTYTPSQRTWIIFISSVHTHSTKIPRRLWLLNPSRQLLRQHPKIGHGHERNVTRKRGTVLVTPQYCVAFPHHTSHGNFTTVSIQNKCKEICMDLTHYYY